MPIDPISQALGDQILREAKRQEKNALASGHWMKCPSCGRRVITKQLMKKGCYVCGWKEGMDMDKSLSYWAKCPKCKTQLVSRELKEKGCYLCGWNPAKER